MVWLDRSDRPEPSAALVQRIDVDLVVVGGGYTGLWAALIAAERDPSRRIAVIEADRVGHAASGRNGGFCSSSLTHGLVNGLERFESEIDTLQRLGHANLDEIESAVRRHGIDCDFERSGNLEVAVAPWMVEPLREQYELLRHHGEEVTWLDGAEARAQLDSPTYEAAIWRRSGEAMVDPARLAWGLAAACRSLGVKIYESTPMTSLDRIGTSMVVTTPRGAITGRAVVLGTGAFDPVVPSMRRRLAAVYDHALATEPLSDTQLASIGWAGRQGVSDTTNLFHYYRRFTDPDGGVRILWGGYDAVYHYGNKVHPSLEQNDRTHGLLAQQFFETFPQLEGLDFSHRWGGLIDTNTRFSVGFGTAFEGQVAYAAGYTGLGVGATRFGAEVCLDLLDRPDSDLCALDFVRRRPLPFPPEPIRWIGITITRKEYERADRNHGHQSLWLRTLSRLGLGFDS